MNWQLIDFNKIPGETLMNNFFDALSKYKFQQLLVSNQDHFFLIGDNSGDANEDYTPKEVASVVFVTSDGGEKFMKHSLGKGTLSEAIIVDNTVFLVNENKGSSQLIKAATSFEKWEVVKEFKNELINHLNFYSPQIGLASFLTEDADQELHSEIKYTLNGGKTWEKSKLNVHGSFAAYLFLNASEVSFIQNNQLIKADFITGAQEVLADKVAPEGYKTDGRYYKNTITDETYTFIQNESNGKLSVKNLKTQEIILLPKGADEMEFYGDYLHSMVKEGVYYHYVWSEDGGKHWNTEVLEDFFITPRPIGYYGKGYVYALASYFKGNQDEKGGRFAIRRPDHVMQ